MVVDHSYIDSIHQSSLETFVFVVNYPQDHKQVHFIMSHISLDFNRSITSIIIKVACTIFPFK